MLLNPAVGTLAKAKGDVMADPKYRPTLIVPRLLVLYTGTTPGVKLDMTCSVRLRICNSCPSTIGIWAICMNFPRRSSVWAKLIGRFSTRDSLFGVT